MCDRQYGTNSTEVVSHNGTFNNNAFGSSHLNYIEQYDPNRPGNVFRWIPEGIYYDLFDTSNEPSPVFDNVSGYTNQQMFNALDADVTSMPQYRVRLLQENGNNQATDVIALFNEYHY